MQIAGVEAKALQVAAMVWLMAKKFDGCAEEARVGSPPLFVHIDVDNVANKFLDAFFSRLR